MDQGERNLRFRLWHTIPTTLEERQQQLDGEIPRLQGEIDSLTIQYLSSEDVFSNTRDFYTRWPEFSFDEKRSIVESVVEHIEIKEKTVALELALSPTHLPSLGNGKTGSA